MKRFIHYCLPVVGLMLAGGQALASSSEADTQKNRVAADALFTNEVILRLQLEISATGVESLNKDKRIYVPMTIREGDTVYTNAMVHLKGFLGSFRKLDDKPGLTIKMLDPDVSPRFHGLKKFHLNNSVQDASYLSEWICTDLFRAANVPANRVAHALVELNGRKLGLYVVLEGMDRDFLGGYFSNTKGNLYGQTNWGDINVSLERMEGKGELTRADLKALSAAAQEHDPIRLKERLPQVLDLDRFLSFMAMEVMLCHWDGYTFAAHNYRVYGDVESGKMVFLPHDLDQMIVDPNVPIYPGAHGLVAKSILSLPETRAQYRQRFGTLFTNVFVVPAVCDRIDHWVAKTAPTLEVYDPRLAREVQVKTAGMKERIHLRAQMLQKLLTLPEPANQILQVNVVDAETQLLIPQVTISPGYQEKDNGFSWDRNVVFHVKNGSFYLDMAEARLPRMPNFLKFEAPGYFPAVAVYNLSTNAEDANYRIELKKGGRIAGTLSLPDGTPATNAQVALLLESANPQLNKGQLLTEPGLPLISSGARARFFFSPDPEAHSLVVVHETGFAEIPVDGLSPASKITLESWSRLEGKMVGQSESVTPCAVQMAAQLAVPIFWEGFYRGSLKLDPDSYRAEVRGNDSFAIEKIPPGERYLWRSVMVTNPNDPAQSSPSHVGQGLIFKPGETRSVVWGENEGALKGQMVWNANPNDPPANSTADESDNPLPVVNIGFVKLTRQEKDTELPQEFFFTLGAEGSFLIPGPAPGSYRADIRLFSPPKWLGWTERNITIPPDSGVSKTKQLDLGKIELRPVGADRVGDSAPFFEIRAPDGSALKLADFRGKFVLLCFWASGFGQQVTVLPALRTIEENFPPNERLVIIGLNLDRDPDAARRYAQRNGLNWRQGHLGEWFQTSLPSQFGVVSLPAAVLVGPDGKILGQNLNFGTLLMTLRSHLK